MRRLPNPKIAIPFLALAAVAAAPSVASAGVMSVTGKAAISLDAQTDQVDWRPYSHRHHRWHPGWRWGYGPQMTRWGYAPRWGYSRWGYGGYAVAAPNCGTWGNGGGLFGAAAGVATAPLWGAATVTDDLFGW